MASTSSNLLPPPEGKRRTAPIAIDYLRRPSRFDAWKGPLALGAALLTIAAVVLVSLPAGGQRIHSRGPLAQVHAALNNDCQSCHVDFVPISGTAAGLAIDTWAHASDANCQACHTGDIHHNNQLLDADRGIQSANCELPRRASRPGSESPSSGGQALHGLSFRSHGSSNRTIAIHRIAGGRDQFIQRRIASGFSIHPRRSRPARVQPRPAHDCWPDTRRQRSSPLHHGRSPRAPPRPLRRRKRKRSVACEARLRRLP